MRDLLAERLLAAVMGWSAEQVAEQRPILQSFAKYKYDAYQQFSPGMRFVESLALWLERFQPSERETAYRFVRERMVFCSMAEMNHLVSVAYADVLRPLLLNAAASEIGVPNTYADRIAASTEFRAMQRRTLFLALSDGAHTDVFRRSNPSLSHEQIWHANDVSEKKAAGMAGKLAKGLEDILGRTVTDDEARFQTLCLLDDFSGSGRSYIREEELEGKKVLDGKIPKILDLIGPNGELAPYVDHDAVRFHIVIYMATEHAKLHLSEYLGRLFGDRYPWSIHVCQSLNNDICVTETRDLAFCALQNQDAHYDPDIEDEHTKKGDGTVRFGFDNCALPVVLAHNTPNNSVFLLWGSEKVRGLFPRVSRHQRQA